MPKRLMLYDEATADLLYQSTWGDSTQVPLAVLSKRADALQANSKASKLLAGDAADPNGDVTYESQFGGASCDEITVEHTAGATGAGNENRALGAAVAAKAVLLTYGTDGAGASIRPSATNAAQEINNTPDVAKWVQATSGGTGAGLVGDAAPTNLEGGTDGGDYLKIDANPPSCHHIHNIEEA